MKFDRMVVIPKETYDQMKADVVESTNSKTSNPRIVREPTRERDVLINQQQPPLPPLRGKVMYKLLIASILPVHREMK